MLVTSSISGTMRRLLQANPWRVKEKKERTHTARKEEPLSVKGNDKTPSYIASSALSRNASFADMMSAMSKKNKVNSCNIHSNQCIEFDVKVLTVVFAKSVCVSFQPRNRQFCTIAETLNYFNPSYFGTNVLVTR